MAKSKLMVVLVVCVLMSNISFGMYDPQTGRFMQRDPIGTAPRFIYTAQGPKIIEPQISPTIIFTSMSTEETSKVLSQFNRENKLHMQGVILNIPRKRILNAASINAFDKEFRSLSQYIDGMNIYEYTKSNPLRYEDPFGLYCPGEQASCLICLVGAEARGTNDICQQAVRETVMNRVYGRDGRKAGKSICEVVSEGDGLQFNGYKTSYYKQCISDLKCCDTTKYEQLIINAIAKRPLTGNSPLTKGSSWFHDTSIDTPPWIKRAIAEGRMEEVSVDGCSSFRFYKLTGADDGAVE